MRALLAIPVLLTAGVVLMPSARADTEQTITPASDGWYQANPSCALATGCVPPALPAQPPASSPFPARTLHIGATAGQETARSVLAFDLSTISATGGVLTVPLDVSQADGSVAPETAKVVACLTISAWKAADGSVEEPPKAECATSVPLAYSATPAPQLQADVGALVAGLPESTGIVLLPDAANLAPTDTWRVVFSAHDREGTGITAPASLLVTVPSDGATPTAEPTISFPTEQPVTEPPAPPGIGVGQPPAIQPPTAVQPSIAPTPQLPRPAARGPVLTSGHYPYLGLGLLPLAVLLLVWFLGRALTMDLGQARRG